MWISVGRVIDVPRVRRGSPVEHVVIRRPVTDALCAGSGAGRERADTDSGRPVKGSLFIPERFVLSQFAPWVRISAGRRLGRKPHVKHRSIRPIPPRVVVHRRHDFVRRFNDRPRNGVIIVVVIDLVPAIGGRRNARDDVVIAKVAPAAEGEHLE